jgi:hypothetical protein
MIIGALDLKEVPAIITRGSVRTSNWREQSAKHDSHSINLKTIINDTLRLYQPSKAMRVRLASSQALPKPEESMSWAFIV